MSQVAVVQMSSQGDVPENLAQTHALLDSCAEMDLIILPENFALMSANDAHKVASAETLGAGPIQDFLSERARALNSFLIAGSIPTHADNGKLHSTTLVYNAEGVLKAHYHKMHLFDVNVSEGEAYCESEVFTSGDALAVVDTPFGQVGLSICYDLRFPELYRALTHQGAQLFVVPAAFTQTTGLAHWEVLLRARAIENLAYVFAPNQCGHHPGNRQTYGHSMIISPWGEVLAQAQTSPSVISAPIDLQAQAHRRQTFAALEHRRLP